MDIPYADVPQLGASDAAVAKDARDERAAGVRHRSLEPKAASVVVDGRLRESELTVSIPQVRAALARRLSRQRRRPTQGRSIVVG
jgi:hypothetical protein